MSKIYKVLPLPERRGKSRDNAYTMYPARYQLDLQKYKDELWTGIKDLLAFFGLGENELSKLKNELVENYSSNNTTRLD